MKLFLLIGQSNMAGRGEFGDVPPLRDPRCKMMRNGRFIAMAEPINCDRPIWGGVHSGIGPAASFAVAFAEQYNEEIGLIPCADGGTSLAEWQPGTILYDHAVFMARLGMRSGEMAGILWHQGEGDSGNEERARTYGERFERMILQMRRDIGAEVPVVAGELGEYLTTYKNGALRYFPLVNEELRRVVAAHADFALASSAGLQPKPDGLHFCAEAQREFGRRYFAAYRSIVG